jgi:hypothetical protein
MMCPETEKRLWLLTGWGGQTGNREGGEGGGMAWCPLLCDLYLCAMAALQEWTGG